MVDDPVAQRLPPRAFRLLVNLMAMAAAAPLPDRGRLGWRLHLSPGALARDLAPLVAAGLAAEAGARIELVRDLRCPATAPIQPGGAAVTHDESAATHDESPSVRRDEGSRQRTRAWRARRRAAATEQPRLPLFSVVAAAPGAGGDTVTGCDVTGDAVTRGDASPPSPGVTHERNQTLVGVTGDASRVTHPAPQSLFKTPDLKKETQTLARDGDAVTRDASPVTSPIAAARAAYDRFRPIYPKPLQNDPSKPAEQEFLKLVLRDGVDPEYILAQEAIFAEQVRRDRTESRYVPASARWLRERRFDDIAAAARPQARTAPTAAGADPWLAPVLSRLEAELGADLVASWFSRLAVVRRDAVGVTLAVPTRFIADWIEAHQRERLRAACRATHGIDRVELIVDQPAAAEPRRARAPP